MAIDSDLESGATYPRGFAIDTDWRWPLIPARDLVALNYGRALKADTRTPGKVPVYGTNGRCGWHDAALAKAPGLILGRKGQGPLGVEWTNHDFWVIDTAYYATPLIDDLDLKFLYHLVTYIGLNHLKDGTSNPTLSRDTFGSQLFPVPPLAEQRAIASVLGALDDKIELNRRMNATLESMARALFQSWMRTHENDVEEFVVQDFINEGVLLIGDGYRAKNSEFAPDGLPFVRAGNLKGDGFDLAGSEVLSASSVVAAGHKTGKVGDVAFTSKGTIGRTTRVSTKTGPFVYSPQVCFWRSMATDRLHPNVLYRWMHSDDFIRQVAAVSSQTDMAPYVSLQDQRKMVVQLPPASAQLEIARQLEPIDEQIAANAEQSRTLASLRDTLLPKLLSGELSVVGAESAMENA